MYGYVKYRHYTDPCDPLVKLVKLYRTSQSRMLRQTDPKNQHARVMVLSVHKDVELNLTPLVFLL